MIILIDNYDSFTFNIYHYLGELGAKVKVFRNDKVSVKEIVSQKPKGIVISPGPKTPDFAGISVNLINTNHNIPILGICLGHQSIGQAYGANIINCEEIMHGKIDVINHNSHKLFKNLEKNFKATRYHSLIIDKKTLPKELKIIAWTNNNIIMGVADNNKKIYGVQFHPESIGTKQGKIILKNFLNLIKYEH
tara:strand:+ start:435 stop:1010 length:576 start_codon:yes stop_codon:yes gene_type:complete